MPKKKTNKATAKRFKITGTGKVMHAKAGSGHLLSSKSRKRKRSLKNKNVLPKAEAARITHLLAS
jgi:large subunit ribosomal protein L35